MYFWNSVAISNDVEKQLLESSTPYPYDVVDGANFSTSSIAKSVPWDLSFSRLQHFVTFRLQQNSRVNHNLFQNVWFYMRAQKFGHFS